MQEFPFLPALGIGERNRCHPQGCDHDNLPKCGRSRKNRPAATPQAIEIVYNFIGSVELPEEAYQAEVAEPIELPQPKSRKRKKSA